MLCVAFFVAYGCNSSHENELGQIIYPKTGMYGLNILADGFAEGKKTDLSSSVYYSMRVELPDGNSSLRIIVKPAKPISYVCKNIWHSDDFQHLFHCGAIFFEWHEICPECGGVKTLSKVLPSFAYVSYAQSNFNWLFYDIENQLTSTFVDELVHKNGKVADAAVFFSDDFIIEYYENGATEPTKVKEVKVID